MKSKHIILFRFLVSIISALCASPVYSQYMGGTGAGTYNTALNNPVTCFPFTASGSNHAGDFYIGLNQPVTCAPYNANGGGAFQDDGFDVAAGSNIPQLLNDTIYLYTIPNTPKSICFEFISPVISDSIVEPFLSGPSLPGATAQVFPANKVCILYSSPVTGNDTIRVNICNDCSECVTGVLIVKVLEPINICKYETNHHVEINEVAGASSYTWAIEPAGPVLTVAGSGLSATINFSGAPAPGLYWLSVIANNVCGPGPPAMIPYSLYDCDLADAPDAPYQTLLVNNGPRHMIMNGLYLGNALPDGETDGQPSPDAGLAGTSGDDGTGTDDENGVTIPAYLIPGQVNTISVAVAGSGGKLNAWIDWNQLNAWAEGDEQVALNATDGGAGDADALVNGVIQLSVNAPLAAVQGISFARFRWSTQAGLSYTGEAPDGEVEDYSVVVRNATDLSIYKTDGSNTYTPGSNVVYSVEVLNPGPGNITGATVTDNAPVGTTITGWTASFTGGASGNSPGNGNINEIVNMPVGGMIIYTVTVAVPGNYSGPLENTADVIVPPAVTDINPANNRSTDTDLQNSLLDLSVTKDDSPDPVYNGQTLTYTITVNNTGPSAATGVMLTDVLPAGINNPELSIDNGSNWAPWSSPLSMGSLPGGSSVTILIRGTIDCSIPNATILSNTAEVNGTLAEISMLNNTSTETTTVRDLNPGSITGNNTICKGTTETYSVPDKAGVVFTWTVPAGSTIISGQGTHEISVTAGSASGQICVYASAGLCQSQTICIDVEVKDVLPNPVFK